MPCLEDNLVGASLLNCEILSFPEEKLTMPVAGQSAVALPVKLYGRPVGCLLIVEAAQPLSAEELWDLGQVVSLVQESVERQEDLAAYTRTTEALLVRAVEHRALAQTGHWVGLPRWRSRSPR